MSNDFSEVFFFHFYPCAGALSTCVLSLSLRFLCVVVESIVEERFRTASPSGTVMMDGKLSLYKIQAYTAYSSLLVPVVAASCLVMGPAEPRDGQRGMLGA